MDHDEIVIMSRTRQITIDDLRRFTRRVCETADTAGWELLIHVAQGMPSYPVIDELINMCIEKIRAVLGPDTINGRLMIEFDTELIDPIMIDKVIVQIERILQGRESLFHLLLLRADQTDEDIFTLMGALWTLYHQLDKKEPSIAIG